MTMPADLGAVVLVQPPAPRFRTMAYTDFLSLELPERVSLVEPILNRASLSLWYAPPGIGKTFFLLGLTSAIAAGQPFLCWQVPSAARVLYCDFEMPAGAMQTRLAGLLAGMAARPQGHHLTLFTPDLQPQDLPMPDLSTVEGQQDIDAMAVGHDLIVIDNLSAAVRTGRENESESWLPVQQWALRHRAAGRSVLFVHHAGKNGQQRGSSKKTDVLDLVVQLRRPSDYEPIQGARFELHVEKGRHLQGDEGKALEVQLATAPDGSHSWTWRTVEQSTLERVVALTQEGLTPRDIAEELQIHKSSVSRALTKARAQGLLKP